MSPQLVSNRGHVMELWARQSFRDHRSRIRSVTVSFRLPIDFFKVTVHVKSRFALTTPFNSSPQPRSLRYVVRWRRQPAAVDDGEDALSRIGK